MKRAPGVMVLAVAMMVLVDGLHACSTFCVQLGGRQFFGRNYDFEIGDGMLLVNPRGLRKKGRQAAGPAWRARYGSITFNQFGRDHPMGGMNERALVVELMWMEGTQYPAPDGRAPLGVLEWIQYQLDVADTVQDVLDSDEIVRILSDVPVHYLVSDASGRATTMEFIDGRLVAHKDDSLPVRVLTNTRYKDALAYLTKRSGRPVTGSGSNERFARAALAIEKMESSRATEPVPMLFELLGSVAQSNTRWSIVYDQTTRVVHFRTDVHRPLRYLALDRLDFSCASGAMLLDIDTRVEGDVEPKLKPYTTAANFAFISRTYAASSVTRGTLASEVAAIAAHPDRATCG